MKKFLALPRKVKLLIFSILVACLLGVSILIGILLYQLNEYSIADEMYTNIEKQNVNYVKENVIDTKDIVKHKSKVKVFGSSDTKVIDFDKDPTDKIEYETPALQIDYNSLLETNEDFIAWIYIPDTRISYPVVKSHDNEEYINTMLDGRKNSAGTIFSDCRIKYPFTQKTILYGHNMKNGTMFKDIYKIETNLDKYHEIWIYTADGTIYHYSILNVKRVDKADKDIYEVSDNVSDTLILSTCVDSNTRLVLQAEKDWTKYN